MHKNTKWAREIIELQEDDGKWGCFHSLSKFYNSNMTTEQALRRLMRLGYTIEDDCIQKAVLYMNDCLAGKNEIPDRAEKVHDWTIFTNLILSTWIRYFTKDNSTANEVAEKWAEVIFKTFKSGEYNHEKYVEAYREILGLKPNGGRLIDFVNFYQISLLHDCLDEKTESIFLDYIISKKTGIYYIYDSKILDTPEIFESKNTSRYLAALELLIRYKLGRDKLGFIVKWLEENKNENGKWDMGSVVNDKVYFPLSDSWRKKEIRELDCTERITRILNSLILTK